MNDDLKQRYSEIEGLNEGTYFAGEGSAAALMGLQQNARDQHLRGQALALAADLRRGSMASADQVLADAEAYLGFLRGTTPNQD